MAGKSHITNALFLPKASEGCCYYDFFHAKLRSFHAMYPFYIEQYRKISIVQILLLSFFR